MHVLCLQDRCSPNQVLVCIPQSIHSSLEILVFLRQLGDILSVDGSESLLGLLVLCDPKGEEISVQLSFKLSGSTGPSSHQGAETTSEFLANRSGVLGELSGALRNALGEFVPSLHDGLMMV